MNNDPEKPPRLDQFEPARRESLRKILNISVVYTAPVVASFSLGGLGGDAQAQSSNQATSPPLGAASSVPAVSRFGMFSIVGAIAAAGALLIRRFRRR